MNWRVELVMVLIMLWEVLEELWEELERRELKLDRNSFRPGCNWERTKMMVRKVKLKTMMI